MDTPSSDDFDLTAADFVAIAHRIVWATAATVDAMGRPRTRVLHPIWDHHDGVLDGWIATNPSSPKAGHLLASPHMSLTYWDATQDTCTADCTVDWMPSIEDRRSVWDRFRAAPPPLGYDPAVMAAWPSPDAEGFGVLHLRPFRLRVMPGSLPTSGEGTLRTWTQPTEPS